MENIHFSERGILIQTSSGKDFKGTVVNRTFLSLNVGSLESMPSAYALQFMYWTVNAIPFRYDNF